MAPEYVISGTVAPGYEPVKEMFEKNFENGTEEHSQLCAYVKGEKVVDLWGTVEQNRNQIIFALQSVTYIRDILQNKGIKMAYFLSNPQIAPLY